MVLLDDSTLPSCMLRRATDSETSLITVKASAQLLLSCDIRGRYSNDADDLRVRSFDAAMRMEHIGTRVWRSVCALLESLSIYAFADMYTEGYEMHGHEDDMNIDMADVVSVSPSAGKSLCMTRPVTFPYPPLQ